GGPAMSAAADTLTQPHDPLAARIATYAGQLDAVSIPENVRAYAKLCLADAIGIGFASHRYDFAGKSVDAIRGLAGDGPFPVVGTPHRLPVRDAALLNGLLMHGLDFDDTHTGAVIHATVSAAPLMLAEAQRHGSSGAQALAAYILAIEVDARIGQVAEGMLQKIGFHPTGLVGIFGATVASGYLGGLTQSQLAQAQGIALSMASGSLEFLADGSWTKRLHPGWAACNAITATALAAGDFRGPLNAYEGRYGLYSLYLRRDDVDVSGLADDMGQSWEMMNVAIKPYPVCHFNHACIDATLAIVREHGLKPDDIASIEAKIHSKQHDVVCNPIEAKRRPTSDYDAKFSLPFAVSAAVVRDRFTLAELYDDALNDAAILSVCDRVTCSHMEDSAYPTYYSGQVVITTTDGRRLEHVEKINRGADSRALDEAAVREKYLGNVDGHLSAAQADALWDAIQTLDGAPNTDALSAAIAGN
ncbi:MAG: MmgE/PrpD family protein, partial [Pseudomonadota bacterium]